MKLNKQYLSLRCIVCIIFFLSSCKKELPPCKSNCDTFNFSGIILDKTNNQPISNAKIDITLYHRFSCILCSSYKLISDKPNKDGRFDFNTEFDTTLLKDYVINVDVSVPTSYISYAEPVGPGISTSTATSSVIKFYQVDVTAMKNLVFEFYSKSLLHINLHRTSPIMPQHPFLDLEFDFANTTSVWGIEESNANKDTTLTINTSTNIFTKIKSYKYTSPTNLVISTDSIKCTAGAGNSIDISY